MKKVFVPKPAPVVVPIENFPSLAESELRNFPVKSSEDSFDEDTDGESKSKVELRIKKFFVKFFFSLPAQLFTSIEILWPHSTQNASSENSS